MWNSIRKCSKYIAGILILCASLLLLGFSFSKESGNSNNVYLNGKKDETFKIVYSNNDVLKISEDGYTDISIVNRKDEEVKYVVTLEELNNKEYKDVYYILNDGEITEYTGEEIYASTLAPFGDNGDHNMLGLKVWSKKNEDLTFKINVNVKKEDTIFDYIKRSEQVYLDSENYYRYYGDIVNNYINVDGEIYQIIGADENKVKLIGSNKGLGVFDTTKGEYPLLKDYLGSFNNSEVNKDNVLSYSSWMNDGGYWLGDYIDEYSAYYASRTYGVGVSTKFVDYFLRYVKYIDSEMIYVSGDGTINAPYEVTYGS